MLVFRKKLCPQEAQVRVGRHECDAGSKEKPQAGLRNWEHGNEGEQREPLARQAAHCGIGTAVR